MMRRYLRAIPALLVCVALLALTACQTGEGEQGQGGGVGGDGMGRYMEEEFSLPAFENTYSILGVNRTPDGVLRMMTEEWADELILQVWYSTDDGKTWLKDSFPWTEDYDAYRDEDYSVTGAWFTSADEVMLYGYHYIRDTENPVEDEAPDDMQEQTTDVPEEEEPAEPTEDNGEASDEPAGEDGMSEDDGEDDDGGGYFEGTLVYGGYRADREGLEHLDRYDFSREDNPPVELRTAANGDLLFNAYRKLTQVDPETDRVKAEYERESFAMDGSWIVDGNRVAVLTGGVIEIYDLESDTQTEIPFTYTSAAVNGYTTSRDDMIAMAFGPDGDDALYFLDAEGLFRCATDGSVVEQIMDCELTNLGLPTVYPQYLFANTDGSFTALCGTTDGFTIYRYQYDPNVSTVPLYELKVYSLQDNQTVRQAMGVFRQSNPDVKVTYQVGMTGQDGITTSDALRSLSTELLADRGPDVLILDGMPVDSYIRQGVLMDLTDLLGGSIESGELLANIAETYRQDEVLYAMPARFSVPMIYGQNMDSVTDLASLVDWMNAQPIQSLGMRKELVMQQLYGALSYGWFRQDGTLNEEQLLQDLRLMAELAAHEEPMNEWQAEDGILAQRYENITGAALYLKSNRAKGGFGVMREWADLAPGLAVLEELGGALQLFPESGVYIPSTIAGINAASAQTEMAGEFVQCLLSEEVQRNTLYDGLAVNTDALKYNIENPLYGGSATLGYTEVDNETGEYTQIVISYTWPDSELLKEWLAVFETLQNASVNNEVVRQMMLEETVDCLTGDITPEEALANLKAKLDLYLAE